jgi:hypothetical protein
MLIMFRAFWASPQRTKILLLGVDMLAEPQEPFAQPEFGHLVEPGLRHV